MFTGIIEEIGTVRSIRGGEKGAVLDIEAAKVLDGTAVGDSIAVNGVCLTVTPGNGHFTADAMPETLRRTSLCSLSARIRLIGMHINPLAYVAASLTREGIAVLVRVSAPSDVLKYIAVKGSVTLDGVSLTVTDVDRESLAVSLIPHTAASTTLGLLHPGSPVNVEVDLLARYVERLLSGGDMGGVAPGGLTEAFLRENGF